MNLSELDIDFGASESWDGAMHERMRQLREHAPVFWSEKSHAWIASKFEDVVYISKNNQLFCSGQGVLLRNPAKLSLIDEDEPRHTELRRLINRGFTPRMVKKLEEVFLEITKDALDEIAEKGECDFVESIAVPLPLLLIAEMIGIRREDREDFHRWSDDMILAQGNMHDPEVIGRAALSFSEFAAYCTALIEERRVSPRDDLLSILVGADSEGVLGQIDQHFEDESGLRSNEDIALSSQELNMLCVLLLVAGNETTRNALSGGIQLLIENPRERNRLIEDPSLIPIAVEEMLRLTSPVVSFARTATQDTVLRDTPIRAGDKVLMLYGSANRDADAFEDPERFDIERNPHHVAFGVGNHFCLGANLARMELRVAFAELLKRLPDMRYVDGGPRFAPSALVRSCTSLRVCFTPEPAFSE